MRGKRLVGLVHHNQPTLLRLQGNDARYGGGIPQVARGVVGIGQIHNGRVVLANGSQHGRFIQLKVCSEWHAMKSQPLQLGTHGVHHEAGNRGQDAGWLARSRWHIAGQGQQADELVRAVAQHDVEALGHASMGSQGMAEIVHTLARVTVDGDLPQALTQCGL